MTNTHTEDALVWKTGILYEELLENGDPERAKQLGFIMKKQNSQEVYLAFAGHYSAGKSSLINALLKENVLPSGPIPTSANLVKVKKGEPRVTLYTSDGECYEMKGRYKKESVQAYCKNGAQAEVVEISGDFSTLGDQAVIIDTPGIDSTDLTHFAHAKSILYQADALFYVVHYNHVHSEENIRFLRFVQEKIPRVYFIINQIDRHDESETSFEAYKKQVVDLLRNEGVKEEQLFFTSATEPGFFLNEIEKLKIELSIVSHQTEEERRFYTERKIRNVLNEHIEHVLQAEENLEELQKRFIEKKKNIESIEENLEDLSTKDADTYEALQAEVNKIISNANLTPFELREKAKAYLESIQPNFKKGLLFSKSKTAAEKQARFENIFSELEDRVRAEMDWHLIDLLKKAMESRFIRDETLKEKVIQHKTEVTESDLLKAVTKGAQVTSEYVLNYSSELADILKRKTKHAVNDLLTSFREHVSSQITGKYTAANNEWLDNKSKLEELEAEIHLHMEKNEKRSKILAIWNNPLETIPNIDPDWFQFCQPVKDTTNPGITLPAIETRETGQELGKAIENKNKRFPVQDYLYLFDNLIQSLEEFDLIKGQWTNFYQKTERLKTKQFTIALFGAFSSGKSSFANALLGEKILPSSPTPTTATINKVIKPEYPQENRTAEIVFKSVEEMELELVNLTGGKYSPSRNRSFEDNLNRILNKQELSSDDKAIISNFLSAFHAYQEQILNGTRLIVNSDELFPFAANERVSCAVKEAIVYLSTPITEKGIMLVDTPGASSINKRHTEAAFHYLKEADAIVYVTYFQHPYTKADRTFIRKLGLVQDSFSMDKMFFVVNASDLAKDDEELNIVTDYVKGELNKEGVSSVNLYPVSSKRQLDRASEGYVNQFRKLKSHLYRFIEYDLTSTSIMQLIKDGKSMCKTIFHFYESLNKTDQEKRAELKNVKDQLGHLSYHVEELKKSTTVKELAIKELNEQLYHIRHRLSFFANDLIKSEFHPGLQNGNWQENSKIALKRCLMAYEAEYYQEMKALEIRMTACFEKLVDTEWISAVQWKAESFGDSFFSFTFEFDALSQKGLFQTNNEPSVDINEMKGILKDIKNVKAFLDPKGKALFVEALRAKLSLASDRWIKEEKLSIASELTNRSLYLQTELVTDALRQMNEQAASFEKAMGETDGGKTLKKAVSSCEAWLKNLRELNEKRVNIKRGKEK